MSAKWSHIVVSALVFSATLVAPVHAQADEPSKAGLMKAVGNPALKGAVSIWVETSDGEVLYDRNTTTPRVPASTMKIVTAVTSLRSLGPRRVFPTIVQQGKTAREIHLVGGGDPLLSAETLEGLALETARNLKKKEIESVIVHADTSLFPPHQDAPGWVEGDSPTYAAAVEPLALLGNYTEQPWREAVSLFALALKEQGIRAKAGRQRSVPKHDAHVLGATVGPETQEAIGLMLRDSENNIAEILFRQVALSQGEKPSWQGGNRATIAVLEEMGFVILEQRFVDGSGLSQGNRLTADFLGGLLLDSVSGSSDMNPSLLRELLPTAGINGTLTYRFTGSAECARGKVFAKTGSLTGVNTLAGLTRTPEGQWRAFAVLVNDWDGSKATWGETSTAIDTVAAATFGCGRSGRR